MAEPHQDAELMERLKAIRADLIAIGCPPEEYRAYIVAFIQAEAMRAEPLHAPERPRPKRVE